MICINWLFGFNLPSGRSSQIGSSWLVDQTDGLSIVVLSFEWLVVFLISKTTEVLCKSSLGPMRPTALRFRTVSTNRPANQPNEMIKRGAADLPFGYLTVRRTKLDNQSDKVPLPVPGYLRV